MMNATLPLPNSLAPAAGLDKRRSFSLSPACVVTLYALAMAWVEAAVVFYLRSMVDRLQPYQPNPLPLIGDFGLAEIVREAATLAMLLAVGWLAGRTARSRFGYTLLAFGVWDIAYYLWLVPLTAWPTSLGDWDILFLIPLPWWGPVWAPMSIAALMIVFGVVVGKHDSPERSCWPGRKAFWAAALGVVLALYVFMADAIQVVLSGGSTAQLQELLPQWFNWPLFLVALALIAWPVAEVVVRAFGGRRPVASFNSARWLSHFAHNRLERPEPDWSAPLPSLAPSIRAPFIRSLEQFRLGDGGGPASLIAFNAEKFRGRTAEMRAIVDAWFKEEAEHARLLGCAVDRFGGRRITSHWSFTAFCLCRRALGVRFELQVLTLTELVSTGYYRVLRRHSPDVPVAAMCALILRDEAGHVAFQRARLASCGCDPRGAFGALWRAQFWLLGHAAAAMLWVNHGPCLTALGGSRAEFFREIRRELRRFIVSLARRRSLRDESLVEERKPQANDFKPTLTIEHS
jgi:hypothetical protein